jgi:V8-like Glu-specific endopeptidase
MKNNIYGFLIFSTLISNSTFAIDKVVYGDDNRLDVFEEKNSLHLNLSKSTAAMIPSSKISENGNEIVLSPSSLETDGICSDEKFSKQMTAAMCSGFLVANQYLVTAGHCIESVQDCESNSWVFDYAQTTDAVSAPKIMKSSVYKCSQIISRTLDRTTMNDYALIKLDRPVTDRSPLNFRKSGKVANNAEIVVIGHPSGLPTKISDQAFVRANTNKYYFQANLDTFGGNSGSAVFDSKTGVIEGILVRGERDYEYDSNVSCYRPKKCEMDACRGEDVTRITNIKELKTL